MPPPLTNHARAAALAETEVQTKFNRYVYGPAAAGTSARTAVRRVHSAIKLNGDFDMKKYEEKVRLDAL